MCTWICVEGEIQSEDNWRYFDIFNRGDTTWELHVRDDLLEIGWAEHFECLSLKCESFCRDLKDYVDGMRIALRIVMLEIDRWSEAIHIYLTNVEGSQIVL